MSLGPASAGVARWPLDDGLYRSPALTSLGLVAAFTQASLGSMGGSVFPQDEQRAHRDALAARLGFPAVVRLKQVHGHRVVYAPFAQPALAVPAAAAPSSDQPWPEGDALWTDRAGVLLGVAAADCVPVLIADRDGRIGAAHAGWQGTTERVAEALVRELVAAGADPAGLVAALGPAIGPCCYGIDAARARTIRERLGDGAWLAERTGDPAAPWTFDVPGANRAQLRAAGVGAVEDSGICTRCGDAGVWSYRSRGERGPQGTGLAVIGRPE